MRTYLRDVIGITDVVGVAGVAANSRRVAVQDEGLNVIEDFLEFDKDSEHFKQTEWIKWCNENYDDKSEKTYHTYWTKSTQKYTDGWKEKLNKQLDPAVNALIGLLASDDEKVRQRAVDQIFKLTGNEETRIAIEGSMDISLNWGDDAAIQSE